MKKVNRLLLLIMASLFFLASCDDDKDGGIVEEKETGFVSFGVTQDVDLRISGARTSSVQAEVPVGQYLLLITDDEGNEVARYEHFADMPATLEMEEGFYTVEVSSNNFTVAAYETPLYEGTEDFEVRAGKEVYVPVTATLANVKATVEYTDNVTGHFDSYSTTVTALEESLEFDENETRAGYFKVAPLLVEVTLDYNGTIRKATKLIEGVEARDWHKISIDAVINGSAGFDIIVNTTLVEKDTEVVVPGDE